MKKISLLLMLCSLAQACGSDPDGYKLTDNGTKSSYLLTPREGTKAAKYCQGTFNKTYAEPYPSGPLSDCLLKIPSSLNIDACTVDVKECVDVTQVSYPVGSNAEDVKKREIDSLKKQSQALREELNELHAKHCTPRVSMVNAQPRILLVSYNADQSAPPGCAGISAALEIIGVLEKDLETQSIGQSSEMLSIAKDLAKAAADIALSASPVGRAKDIYEGLIGTSVIPPFEKLATSDRVIAIIGALTTGSGTVKAISKIAKQVKELKHVGEAVNETNKVLARVRENFPELRKAVDLLKRNKLDSDRRRQVLQAFGTKSKVRILEHDQKVYRYYLEGKSNPRGSWVTNTKVKDPVKELALPQEGNYSVTEWTILKGTEVIEGPISPNFGRPGGGSQIFVPDPGVLK